MDEQSPRPACFAHVADEQWNDWRWQLKNRLSKPEDLEGLVELDEQTREEIRAASDQFLMGITPYYASLMQEGDLTDPIYLQAVPQGIELARADDELEDPLVAEEHILAFNWATNMELKIIGEGPLYSSIQKKIESDRLLQKMFSLFQKKKI